MLASGAQRAPAAHTAPPVVRLIFILMRCRLLSLQERAKKIKAERAAQKSSSGAGKAAPKVVGRGKR